MKMKINKRKINIVIKSKKRRRDLYSIKRSSQFKRYLGHVHYVPRCYVNGDKIPPVVLKTRRGACCTDGDKIPPVIIDPK